MSSDFFALTLTDQPLDTFNVYSIREANAMLANGSLPGGTNCRNLNSNSVVWSCFDAEVELDAVDVPNGISDGLLRFRPKRAAPGERSLARPPILRRSSRTCSPASTATRSVS